MAAAFTSMPARPRPCLWHLITRSLGLEGVCNTILKHPGKCFLRQEGGDLIDDVFNVLLHRLTASQKVSWLPEYDECSTSNHKLERFPCNDTRSGDLWVRCRKEVFMFPPNGPLAKFLDASSRGTRSNIWWKQYVDTERAQEMNLSSWISMDPTYGKWFHGEEAVMSKSWMPFLKKGIICCLVHDGIMPSEFINRAELGCERGTPSVMKFNRRV